MISHYKYLEAVLPTFFPKVGISWDWNGGVIGAHGDKGYGYKGRWEKAGIPFYHGMALYLMTYCNPYSKELGDDRSQAWQWVIDNYPKFKDLLPASDILKVRFSKNESEYPYTIELGFQGTPFIEKVDYRSLKSYFEVYGELPLKMDEVMKALAQGEVIFTFKI